MSFTQPCCNGCWPDYAISERGYEYDPVRIRSEMTEEERCCFCGTLTRSGIYVRVDPNTVAYPRED